MKLFLRFLYTGTCDPNDADLLTTARLYAMADKYLVPPLKALALKRFRAAAKYTWMENKDFPGVVDEIYGITTDGELRDMVCRFVGKEIHREDVLRRMQPVMAMHGEFASKMVELVVRRTRLLFYERVGCDIENMGLWRRPREEPQD